MSAEQARESMKAVHKHCNALPGDADAKGWGKVHAALSDAHAAVGNHVAGMKVEDAVDADWKAGGRSGDAGKI